MSQSDNSDSGSLDEISLDLSSLEGLVSESEEGGVSSLVGDSFFGGGERSNSAEVKLTAIEAFINAATRNCSYTDLVTDILLAIMNAIQSEAASILEIDQEKQALFFRCSVGRASDLITGFVIPLGRGIVGQVVDTRLPVIINNVEENAAHLKALGDAVGFETTNMMAVPLIIRGRVYGVLELLNRVGRPNYSTDDLQNLTYLCEIASKVIELRMMISWGK